MKKILIIAATHGNEPLGVETSCLLAAAGWDEYFDLLIANPRALKEKKEFIDVNLNRSYPGKKHSKLLERRLAYKNLQLAESYRYVIDIHEASRGSNDFIIVPRRKISKKFPLRYLRLGDVLLWPDPRGPLGDVLPNCVELEFGMKGRDRKQAIDKAAGIISDFIAIIYGLRPAKKFRQKFWLVNGKLPLDDNAKRLELKDFQKTKIADKIFYPLLTDQYRNYGIKCYQMQKLPTSVPKSRSLKAPVR